MSPSSTQNVEAVIAQHLQAVISKDVDEILKDYTEDSFVLTQNGPFRGLKELRLFFESFVAALTPAIIGNLEITRLDSEGETVYLLFSAPPLTSLGTDTFIVQNGKIMAQTFTILG